VLGDRAENGSEGTESQRMVVRERDLAGVKGR